jgi:hypothetical protein
MNLTRSRAVVVLVALFTIACTLRLAAQDVVTVGTVNATGSTVDVPVSIRDTSGTPLGIDRPAGSKIQAFSIKVTYSPAASVSSVTFTRAGVTAGLTPAFESAPATSGAISLLESFQESTNPIPFTLNAPAPGDLVAHLVFNLAPNAPPGSTITLTLDPSLTQLTDDGGSAATKEQTSNGTLTLVNGSITLPPLSITLSPSPLELNSGTSSGLTVSASANVTSDTTVTLTPSNPAVADSPASVVINAGTRNATFSVTAGAAGTASIMAALPASVGGATATALVVVSVPCGTLNAPVLSGSASAQAGAPYTISWAAVTGASDYRVEEAADATFANATTTTTTSTSATFTHGTGTFFYRVRAHSQSGSCNITSLPSAPLTVNVTTAPVALKRIIPVVGSVNGNFGSFFRTAVQLYNPNSVTISGKIVFHTQRVSASSGDPFIAYTIGPRKTLAYADLLPAMGIPLGLGSADLIGDVGSPLPLLLARVFNDGGALGTTGLTEEAFRAEDALQQGDVGALMAPADRSKFRLNIGVRTLDQQVKLAITVTDKDGNVVKNVSKTYDPNYFLQDDSGLFLDGYSLGSGDTISFEVTSGSVFIYGGTTDNATSDPSVQFARRSQ